MGHKSITVALVLGLISLPLACGGDDDDVGSTGGKGGKAGGGRTTPKGPAKVPKVDLSLPGLPGF